MERMDGRVGEGFSRREFFYFLFFVPFCIACIDYIRRE